ncbi:hypothetical protein [Endozoicomonas sp. 8E]|uniref:hypothetical protein n=1 Tax=Endozoicomonas sp. 8E TaxID=3035692 RepID=UPI0029391C70|nr:hypothetical protein [Endozoicomonas sp. 8E]WOG29772.1 hypothetical protein P6910_08980 [Endozoicomonas sp. 8E]
MDQAIKPDASSGGYILAYPEMLADAPSRNRADAEKYLPNLDEYTENQSVNKDLSSRCISLAHTENNDDNHHLKVAKNIVFNLDRTLFESIDEESWKNMADSLKFSGIDSLEKAIAMDLRVCPPCPVFHTWVALHGTTIFNGLNNPEKLAGINYVQRILEEGTNLSKSDIPLLIVYSDKNLTTSQINEMKAEFKDHDNILCISFETELQLKFIAQLERYASSIDFHFMDSIRIIVSQNITKTISFCINKAKSENKTELANRLEKLGFNHLFYSDIDNQWLSRPPYILASHGTFTQPMISETLPLIHIREGVVEKLSEINRKLLEWHTSFFSEMPYFIQRKPAKWSAEKAKKLFDYILSGDAESNYEHLSKQIAHISPHFNYLLIPDGAVSWEGENSCCFFSEQSKDVFLRGALKCPFIIDLHQKPDSRLDNDSYNPDQYYKEAHSLVGMQLLKYHSHGHDDTWHITQTMPDKLKQSGPVIM